MKKDTKQLQNIFIFLFDEYCNIQFTNCTNYVAYYCTKTNTIYVSKKNIEKDSQTELNNLLLHEYTHFFLHKYKYNCNHTLHFSLLFNAIRINIFYENYFLLDEYDLSNDKNTYKLNVVLLAKLIKKYANFFCIKKMCAATYLISSYIKKGLI